MFTFLLYEKLNDWNVISKIQPAYDYDLEKKLSLQTKK